MHKKTNKKRMLIIISVTVCIMVVGYIYLSIYFNNKISDFETELLPIENSKNQIFQKQKDALISNLNSFKKFGDWPVGKVELTPDRGNPFLDKTAEPAQQ